MVSFFSLNIQHSTISQIFYERSNSDAGAAFKALDAKMAEVAAVRRDFQLAADTVWPAGIPANAPIRAEFKLPPNRAMK